MKKYLFLITIFVLSNTSLASDWLCINNLGIPQEYCLKINNAKECNNQGPNGLDCFWHYNLPGGACYSEETNTSSICSSFNTSYTCEANPSCHWSGMETPIDPYEPDEPEQPAWICAQTDRFSTVNCGGLNRFSCERQSSCAWVKI